MDGSKPGATFEAVAPIAEPKAPRLARGTVEIPPATDAVRGEDVVAISHDLRAPLSVIALEVSMLEETLPAERHDARCALARIARNLRYVDNLIHDLLDLSAIDASRFAIQTEPTELCGLVAEVVDRMVSTREHDRVKVEIHGTLVVDADARRIERVVTNLVQNALKYSPRTAPISVLVERDRDRACVSVVDAGPGMPPDEAARAFDKFRRCRTTSQHAGYGLGLYVSRKIIEAHGGTIGVDSVLGLGSRFHFRLPLLDVPVERSDDTAR